MRPFSKIGLLLVVLALLGTSVVYADVDKDKDKDKDKKVQRDARQIDRTAAKVGDCNLGSAAKDLDGNNVRARLFNNGHLFWKGSGNVYTVPIGGEANSIFASGIWIGGLDDNGTLRFAGTAYGPFEFWPGPLDDNGEPPADCSQFDRIFKITRTDINNLNEQGQATGDILDWPWELGAPVVDGDGNPNNYNLEGGDRPELIGEQTAWWIMNDAGNVKEWSQTPAIGLEVQVTAFAFKTADALNNTTFYKYKLIHKGDQALNETYFGIWSDPDLGNAADDFVGSDTTLGIGYVYNGTNNDQGFDGYGTTPPALAYDFFQGPLIPSPGDTHVDPDGTVHEDSRRIQMTRFVYYNNDSTVQGNPTGNSDDPYNYLRGVWRDGSPITFGGTGLGGTQPTNFMFPGDPVSRSFWSEENTDGLGSRNTPADRRFLLSAGPFTLAPGDVQEIVYGIVWARSANRLASVAQMRFDDILAQGAFNSNFDIPPPPEAPAVEVAELDSEVIISWSNRRASNNYLNKYDDPSAFLVDLNPPDGNTTYTFEGYRVIQYASPADQTGRVIATYDVVNNVTTVVDEALDIASGTVVTKVVAQGSDSGVQTFHVVPNLTNYQDYYFGVQAYAYNPNSLPKVYASPVNRITVTPRKPDALEGGTVLTADSGLRLDATRTQGSGDTFGVFGTVVDPLAVSGDTYTVRVYDAIDTLGEDITIEDPDHPGDFITFRGIVVGGDTLTTLLTYDIVSSGGETIIKGDDFIKENDKNVPFGTNILTIDGLALSVDTAPPTYTNFLATANGAGPIDPPTGAAADFQGFPVPERPGSSQQVGEGAWMIGTGDNGNRGSFDAFISRTSNGNFATRQIIPYDFEIRFTEEGSIGYDPFCTGNTMPVPFELWRIGINTPDDPSDDVRMAPYILDNDFTSLVTTTGLPGFNLNSTASIQASTDAGIGACASASADHSGSSLNNDPATDWFYWTTPDDASPGEAGYRAWEAAAIALGGGDDGSFYNVLTKDNSIRRMVLFNWNGGDVDDGHPYDQDMPETGTVFRIVTSKPLAPGDVFTINAAEVAPIRGDGPTAQTAIERIGMVPNPYKGASAYEIDLTRDEVRFTNLPDRATIRIFNLAGTLIRTLELGGENAAWDLRTQDGLPIASGMYLVHVEVPGVGEKIIKFGVVMKRVQLDLF